MLESEDEGNCKVCSQPAKRRCSSCRLVFYCNEEHQKVDWEEHKAICKPFEISQSQQLGKYLKAVRDLKPGDVIFSESPLLVGPQPHLLQKDKVPCVGCLRLLTATNHKCPNCFWPSCTPSCPGLEDKARHALECRILQLRKPTPDCDFYQFYRYDVLIILRALFIQKTSNTKWLEMLDLEDHLDKRGPGSEVFQTVCEKVKFLDEFYLKPLKQLEMESGKAIFGNCSNDLIHKLYGILDVNSTELVEETLATVLYPLASLMEHNCTPNTCQSIEPDSFRITVRAALPIAKGEHITSIYTHILWGTHQRRAHLKETKYFDCKCNRCMDPTEFGTFISALKCLGTDKDECGGTQLPVNPIEDKVKWMCDRCKLKLPNDEIMKFVDHLGGEVDKVLENKPKLEEIEELQTKLEKFLHPNHFHLYTVRHTLVQMYNKGSTEGIELSSSFLREKLKICESLIETTCKIDPGNARLSLYLAVLLHELFQVRFALLQREELKPEAKASLLQVLNQAEDVLKWQQSDSGAKLLQVITNTKLQYQNL